MGIDYQAAIMIGLPQGNIEYNEDEYEDLSDFLNEHGMELCAPSYDGDDADDAIAGFVYKCTGSYQSDELDWNQAEIDKLKAKFKEITGEDARVYLSPWGY